MRATDTILPTLPPNAPGRRWIALLLSLLVVAAGFAPAVLAPPMASADPGNEWSDATSRVFLSQGEVFADASEMHVGEQNPDGSFDFTNLGTDGVTYNSTAYNPGDGHIYGVVMTTDPGGDLTADRGDIVVIGDGHTVDSIIDANLSLEDHGPTPIFFVGAIDPATNLMYVTQGNTDEADTFLVVDSTTGTVDSEVTLTGSMSIADWTFADGYLWGLAGENLYRIDPSTGDITSSTIPLEPGDGEGAFGGAWTFGNGNLGFSDNVTGNVYQVEVVDPTSPGWTAEVVAVVGGPGDVGFNDATYIAAAPRDLEVTKDAPATYAPDTSYDYTLTVTNNGPGQSSGWTVSDTIPDGLTIDNVANDAGASCPVDGQVVTCSGGQLDVDDPATITITVTSESDAPECLTNTASVLGNEDDPNPANDEASATSCSTGVTVDKSVDPASGSAVEAGDTLDYTLTFSNDSEFVSSPVAYDDYLGALLDDAAITTPPASSSTNLAVSPVSGDRYSILGFLEASEVATVTYTVEVLPQADRGDHLLGNFVTEPGDTPPPGDPDEVCEDWNLPCTSNPVPALNVSKSVDPADGSTVEPGDTLTYTLTFDSVGSAPAEVSHDDVVSGVLDDATVTQDPEPGVGDLSVSAIDGGRFTVSGVVPAGEAYTVTYTVQVLPDEQRGDDVLGNFVVDEDEDPPPDDCEPDDPLCTSHPVEELVVTKSVDPADGSTVATGDTLTYTLTFESVGAAQVDVAHDDVVSGILDDAEIVDTPATDSALDVSAIDGGRFAVTGTLDGHTTAEVSYTVQVLPDQQRGDDVLGNFVVEPGEDPPPDCAASDPTCTSNPVEELVVTKSVDPVDGSVVEPGDELTYTIEFDNLGATDVGVAHDDVVSGVLDDATITQDPGAGVGELTASAITDGRFTVTGDLPAGETATVTYTVQVLPDDQRGDDVLRNFVVEPGDDPPPDCAAGDPTCTSNPVAGIVVDKGVEPASGTTVETGDTLTYTLTFENVDTAPSDVAYDDYLADVLDDAIIVAGPSTESGLDVSGVTAGERYSVTGTLQGGEIATVTYTVEVLPPDQRGDDFLGNFVTDPGETPPDGPPDEVCADRDLPCTSNPVAEVVVDKTVDPRAGTQVTAGQSLTYTLTFTNTGNGLGQVAFDDDLSGVLDDAQLQSAPVSGSASLATGQIVDGRFAVRGELEGGQSAEVVYIVTVRDDAEQGDRLLENFVVQPSEVVSVDASCSDYALPCTSNPTEPLPTTGAGALRLLLIGLTVALIGAGLVRATRGRRLHTVARTGSP